MVTNKIHLVSVQIVLLQIFINSCSARPDVVTTLSRLGVPAVTETMTPNTMLPTSVISNMPCGSTYRFVPSCLTSMPTPDTPIPSNVNVIQTRLPVSETILSNVAPFTTVIQDTSVSNNLANALQLLVVSNLLSNTLPLNDAVSPMMISGPVFEQTVEDACVNKPLLNNINPCGNVVNFV